MHPPHTFGRRGPSHFYVWCLANPPTELLEDGPASLAEELKQDGFGSDDTRAITVHSLKSEFPVKAAPGEARICDYPDIAPRGT